MATAEWHDGDYSIAFVESELTLNIDHLVAMRRVFQKYEFSAEIRDGVLYVDEEIGNEADMMFNLRTKAGW